jgi:MFS family permease
MTAVRSPGPPAAETLWSIGLMAPIAATFTFGVGLSLSLPLLSLILEARGVPSYLIGLNSATAGVASIAATSISVPLARRLGTASGIAAAIGVAAVSLLAFYAIDALWAWFLIRISFHGALTVIFVLSEYWISAAAPERQRGLAMGLYGTALSIGFAVGPTMLGVIGTHGFLPFGLGAAVIAVTALPILAARGWQPRLATHGRTRILAFVAVAPLAMFASFTFGAVESGAMALMPIYGIAVGYSTATAALMVTALALGNVVSQIPIGWLADRIERRQLLLGCAVAGVAGAALLPAASADPLWLAAVLFVWGGVVAGLYTIGLTHLGSRYKGLDLVSANAAFVMMYASGVVVGPAAMGAGMDLWRPHGLAVVMGVILAIYAAVAAVRLATARPA